MTTALTAEQSREAICTLLGAIPGWVPVAELAARLRTLGITSGQGRADLRVLLAANQIERRDSPTTRSRRGPPAAEYRLHVALPDEWRCA